MKMNSHIIKTVQRWSMLCLLAGAFFGSSCEADKIVVGEKDSPASFAISNQIEVYLRDSKLSSRRVIPIDLRSGSGSEIQVYLGATRTSAATVSANITIGGQDLVDAYNRKHITAYRAFPAANATISGNGAISIAEWHKESARLTVTLDRGTLEEDSYLLPIVLNTGNMPAAADDDVLYYIVKVTSIPSIVKYSVLNGQPLAVLAYTGDQCLEVGRWALEDGTPLFDYIVLFSIGITNVNPETGRVELNMNSWIGDLLRNRETQIKPLQDKGIKVMLGILGGNAFGLSNMQGQMLENFAAQVKNIVDIFGLDGIDLDDEYVDYPTLTVNEQWYPEWERGVAKAARLVIELRRVMPDKIISVYEYGSSYNVTAWGNTAYDGVFMRDIVDLARQPYYTRNSSGLPGNQATSRTGLSNDRFSPAAFWISQGGTNWTQQSHFDFYFNSSNWLSHSGGTYGHYYYYGVGVGEDHREYLSMASRVVFGQEVIKSDN